MDITFLGGAGTVTGSRFLVTAGDTSILVDCGLFQGLKRLRLRNREHFPVDLRKLDAVVLTHAHLDHSGYLPVLVRDGYRGPIYCTPPTRDLCAILLPDSGRLQEEDARYANKRGFSKHHPAEPLYTERDALAVPRRMTPVALGEVLKVGSLRVRLVPAGHILGAAGVIIDDGETSVLFSGDLGRDDDLLMERPARPERVDYVVTESTYGDRLHDDISPIDALGMVLQRTLEREGTLLIPAFAVGRTQTLLYCLHALFQRGDVPRVPVYVNSPMATDVTELYLRHHAWHKLSEAQCRHMCKVAEFVTDVDASIELVRRKEPMVVVSASGMLTGGRVLHHLRALAPEARNTILLPGYQAPGTRGADLVAGAAEIKVHGRFVPVRAEIAQLNVLSAHADQRGILDWLGAIPEPPRGVFVVHGDPEAADTLRRQIDRELGFEAYVPDHQERVRLAKA